VDLHPAAQQQVAPALIGLQPPGLDPHRTREIGGEIQPVQDGLRRGPAGQQQQGGGQTAERAGGMRGGHPAELSFKSGARRKPPEVGRPGRRARIASPVSMRATGQDFLRACGA